MRIGDPPVSAVLEEALFKRFDRHERDDDHEAGDNRYDVVAEADSHPEGGNDPDHRGSREAANVFALTEDASRSQEADTGDDLGGDPGRVDGLAKNRNEAEPREKARAGPDERHRAHSCRMSTELALRAEGKADQKRNENPKGEVKLARDGRGSAPAGTTSGPVLRAGLVLGTRLVGKLGEVQAVDEVAEDREPLFVDDSLHLVLVALGLVGLRDDACRLHHLGRDEDRALDTDGESDGVTRPRVEVEGASVLLDVEARVEDLVGQPRDDDSPDADPQVAERRRHEVMRQRTAKGVA